ncbi:MAG: amidase, partial [Actinomycetia bacterium]|nr:amidase [Actinomycetes bacterium]
MPRGVLLLLLFVGAVVGAPTASARDAVQRPSLTWVRGQGSYTEASRTPKSHTIDTIVIHATDGGSLLGNVWWLSGGHSHASAHYVIARDGSIVQLVHLSDIAWHAGNWKVNCHSIGIEHVGETYDPAGFTVDEYRSSARLVAWLVRR